MSKPQVSPVKVFSTNGALTQFGSTITGTPVTSTDPAVLQALNAFLNGIGAATIDQNQGTVTYHTPQQDEFNGLFYVITQALNRIQQSGGILDYNITQTYSQYAVVSNPSTTELYVSLQDGNLGNLLTNTSYWSLLGDLANLKTTPLPKGYIVGIRSVGSGVPGYAFTRGRCRDYLDTQNIIVNTGFVKLGNTGVLWAEGNNQSGLAILPTTTTTPYYTFVIAKEDGTVDGGFDTDINASNLLALAASAGYTKYRRIHAISCNSTKGGFLTTPWSHANNWTIASIISGLNSGYSATNPGTSDISLNLFDYNAVYRPGIIAKLRIRITDTVGRTNGSIIIRSGTSSTSALDNTFIWSGNGYTVHTFEFMLSMDPSSRFTYKLNVSDANITVRIDCVGWYDPCSDVLL